VYWSLRWWDDIRGYVGGFLTHNWHKSPEECARLATLIKDPESEHKLYCAIVVQRVKKNAKHKVVCDRFMGIIGWKTKEEAEEALNIANVELLNYKIELKAMQKRSQTG
jgi:hypothetical protein